MKSHGTTTAGGITPGALDLTVRPYDSARYAEMVERNSRALEMERRARQAYVDAQQGKGKTGPKPPRVRAPREPRPKVERAPRPPKPPAEPKPMGRIPVPIDPADIAKVRDLYESGLTASEIVTRLGITRSRVRRIMREGGIAVRGATERRIAAVDRDAPLDEAALIADYVAGMALSSVARKHHVRHSRAARILTTAGVPLRPTRGATP